VRGSRDEQVVVDLNLRSFVVLAAVYEPLHDADDQDDSKSDDAVVHVAPCYRELGREDEKDCRNDDIGDPEQVGEPGERLRKFEAPNFR